MRILFIIIGLLGLLLAGLVMSEMRTAYELSSQIKEVQSNFSQLSKAAAKRGVGYALDDHCLSGLLDEMNALKYGWIGVAVCSGISLLIGLIGILAEKKSRKQAVSVSPVSDSVKGTLALIVLAIILAGCSWPLLYVALVRKYAGLYGPPVTVIFISWIASGLLWGVFIELLYRLICYKRPNHQRIGKD